MLIYRNETHVGEEKPYRFNSTPCYSCYSKEVLIQLRGHDINHVITIYM